MYRAGIYSFKMIFFSLKTTGAFQSLGNFVVVHKILLKLGRFCDEEKTSHCYSRLPAKLNQRLKNTMIRSFQILFVITLRICWTKFWRKSNIEKSNNLKNAYTGNCSEKINNEDFWGSPQLCMHKLFLKKAINKKFGIFPLFLR